MYAVEVYTRRNGNVLRSRSGFRSIEAAMNWGEKVANDFGSGADYRVFPASDDCNEEEE